MSACKSCGAPVLWAKSPTGANMPIERADNGNLALVGNEVRFVKPGEGAYASHFATCPAAREHRRPKAKEPGKKALAAEKERLAYEDAMRK